MREAQVNLAIRWFIGYGLHERLPDHSSLTRIRQCWGESRFREIFYRTVRACLDAKVAKAEVVHVDASLIRADVSWESLAERHVDDVMQENPGEEEDGEKKRGGRGGKPAKVSRTDPDARLATSGGRGRAEPSYKQHAVVDDARGVVLDVSVTSGSVNEGDVIESQVEAVCEVSGRAIARAARFVRIACRRSARARRCSCRTTIRRCCGRVGAMRDGASRSGECTSVTCGAPRAIMARRRTGTGWDARYGVVWTI